MIETHFFTFTIALFLTLSIFYHVPHLRQKKIWYLSLQQVILLVVVPGLIFPMLFAYLLSMMELPTLAVPFVSDKFLVSVILLSTTFMYGGVSIHAVTKILSEHLADKGGEAAKINKFFHMTFSHNLLYIGGVTASLGLTFLELNHVPQYTSQGYLGGILRGLLLGGAFLVSMYQYTRYTVGDVGRWSDFKISFVGIWVGFMLLIYGMRKLDPNLTDYQILMPVLISFSLMTAASMLLVVRRLKRGGYQVWIGKRKLKTFLASEERA